MPKEKDKKKIAEHNSMFSHLVGDKRKKDGLRAVLKQFDKTLDDYNYLWKDKKHI